MTGAFVEELTWQDVRTRLAGGATAVLPIGAAAKEHGPHLPMGTDHLQARFFGRALCDRHDVLVWPTVGYGHYPAFVHYAGSVSLSTDLFARTLTELVEGILDFEPRGVLILNTGISTIAPAERAIAECRAPDRVRLANVYRGPRYSVVRDDVVTQTHGTHADEIETSVMLVVCPDRVTPSAAERWDGRPKVPGPFRPDEPDDPNYSPSGIYGDATAADLGKGERIVAAIVEDLEHDLEALRGPA